MPHRPSSLLIAAALTLALAACGEEAAEAPGGVSVGEAKDLEEAASMLDERRLPPEALPPEAPLPATTPEEMTGDSAGPSRE